MDGAEEPFGTNSHSEASEAGVEESVEQNILGGTYKPFGTDSQSKTNVAGVEITWAVPASHSTRRVKQLWQVWRQMCVAHLSHSANIVWNFDG